MVLGIRGFDLFFIVLLVVLGVLILIVLFLYILVFWSGLWV